MEDLSKLKVAIVCDWLTGIGGAERVVLELHKMFPDAPIYTSQYDSNKIDWFKNADIRTTWLQKLPSGLKKFMPPLRALEFSRLDLSQYDLVISETGAEAKAVKIGPKTIHICICNTPTHYYWSRYNDYINEPGFGIFNSLARFGLKLMVGPMRRWDYKAAQKPTHMIAISSHIKSMIKEYYGRESVVIHPPVDTERFTTKTPVKRSGFVVTGRQTPYKRIDLAVGACTRLGLPLIVIGSGPEHSKLVSMAGPTIKFNTSASDTDVANYVKSATAFIFPGIDDFGISAVEALAAGTPVIAFKGGGSIDYIVPGVNGLFFTDPSIDSLCKELTAFDYNSYDKLSISKSAEQFSPEKFSNSMLEVIKSRLN